MTGKGKPGTVRFFHSLSNIIIVPIEPICTLMIHPSVKNIFVLIDEYGERTSKSNRL